LIRFLNHVKCLHKILKNLKIDWDMPNPNKASGDHEISLDDSKNRFISRK
jgi:hypothetical protein